MTTTLVSKVETPINYGIYYSGFGVFAERMGLAGGWRTRQCQSYAITDGTVSVNGSQPFSESSLWMAFRLARRAARATCTELSLYVEN